MLTQVVLNYYSSIPLHLLFKYFPSTLSFNKVLSELIHLLMNKQYSLVVSSFSKFERCSFCFVTTYNHSEKRTGGFAVYLFGLYFDCFKIYITLGSAGT